MSSCEKILQFSIWSTTKHTHIAPFDKKKQQRQHQRKCKCKHAHNSNNYAYRITLQMEMIKSIFDFDEMQKGKNGSHCHRWVVLCH